MNNINVHGSDKGKDWRLELAEYVGYAFAAGVFAWIVMHTF